MKGYIPIAGCSRVSLTSSKVFVVHEGQGNSSGGFLPGWLFNVMYDDDMHRLSVSIPEVHRGVYSVTQKGRLGVCLGLECHSGAMCGSGERSQPRNKVKVVPVS